MAKAPRVIPDLSNATPEFLVAEIRKARDMQVDGKFFEGLYKEKLKTFAGYDQKSFALHVVGDYNVSISTASVERIDVDAIKAAFSREELIEKKFLIGADATTLNIKPVA